MVNENRCGKNATEARFLDLFGRCFREFQSVGALAAYELNASAPLRVHFEV